MSVFDRFKRSLYSVKNVFSGDSRRALYAPLDVNRLLPKQEWKLDEDANNVRLYNDLGKEVMTIGKLLGKGSFGSVFRALVSTKKKDGSDSVMPIAVKISKEAFAIPPALVAETLAYRHLSMDEECSPLVTCLYVVFVTKVDPYSPLWNFGIAMELMDGHLIDLARRIKKTLLPENSRYSFLIYITLYMIYDLYYMHYNGCVLI
jgi:serine/threonine protein kinase